MEASSFLDQLLQSGKDLAKKGMDEAEKRLDIPEQESERKAMMSGLGKGAIAAGALAILLGTGGGRRLTGTALKLGSLAALGGVAYKAFKKWQTGQLETAGTSETVPDEPISALRETKAEDRSLLLLKAMIGAAKADGHIDDAERKNINGQIKRLGLNSEIARFLKKEIEKPLDPEALAADVNSTETAAEIYLVSLMVIDVDNIMERQYLESLAKALNLPPDLVIQLEKQAQA